MTRNNLLEDKILVAIDVAKVKNDVLVELPDGKRKKFIVANKLSDFKKLTKYLKSFNKPCVVAFEATGNYHRPIAYHLLSERIEVKLVSSLASAKTRQALYNSWDKNDPKDAQVILHLLRTGVTQIYHDPLYNGFNDIQEISKTYHQVSMRKVRVQHNILTHYLPLYFPEADRYINSSRAEWFSGMLMNFPNPASVTIYSKEEFIKVAWDVVGRKVSKTDFLSDFYETAKTSIGIPVDANSTAMLMFKTILQEHQDLCKMRKEIEVVGEMYLQDNTDYHRLRTLPGIGPILALSILAEAGDLRRFGHYRQFLKYCGFDLSTMQSGRFRGLSRLSKHGNARLRSAFWMAATVAIRMRENTFRRKYENYIKADPNNADLKRKAYTATAAKMARVAHAMLKNETDYRCYYEHDVPSGRIPSVEPLRR